MMYGLVVAQLFVAWLVYKAITQPGELNVTGLVIIAGVSIGIALINKFKKKGIDKRN